MKDSWAEQSKSWRDYQRRLKRASRKGYLRSRLPLLGFYGAAAFTLLAALFVSGSWIFAHLSLDPPKPEQEAEAAHQARDRLLHEDLSSLLRPAQLKGPEVMGGKYAVEAEGGILTVETGLDQSFQAYILNLLSRSLTHKAAVTAIDPTDGRVLAMASWAGSEGGASENLCLKAEYPAASLFKMVAAAAAIEAKGFEPGSPLHYRGRRYTLYKSQLEEAIGGRYTHEISFKRAFSSSINPVFGRIGIYHLGKELLGRYADKFLFNASIPLELPLQPSRIEVPDDPFGLAEIASGFNKRTLISPVHACLMTAAVANGGVMMRPWVVGRVVDATGKELYRAEPAPLAQPIREETALEMRGLMQATVEQGTCRKAFAPLLRKKSFAGMELGAKTGTINDKEDRYKFDWVSAYALPEDGRAPVVITVLAVHGKKLGIRAKDLARYILEHRYSS